MINGLSVKRQAFLLLNKSWHYSLPLCFYKVYVERVTR